MRQQRHFLLAVGLLTLAAALVLGGCGGGGGASSAATGQARFTVLWPQAKSSTSARPHLIPALTNSIVVSLTDAQNNAQTQTLTRPTTGPITGTVPGPLPTTATFTGLVVGTATATILAFASTDGSGVALAKAGVPITITAGQTATASVTTASTIQSVLLPPAVLAPLSAGQTLQLTAVAFDGPNGSGNVVLTNPAAFTWTSSNPALATVGPATGLVTAGTGSGTVAITATLAADEGPAVSSGPTAIRVANSVTGSI